MQPHLLFDNLFPYTTLLRSHTRAGGGGERCLVVKVCVQIGVEYGGGSSSECVLCAKPLDAPLGRSQIVFWSRAKTPALGQAHSQAGGAAEGRSLGSKIAYRYGSGVQVRGIFVCSR